MWQHIHRQYRHTRYRHTYRQTYIETDTIQAYLQTDTIQTYTETDTDGDNTYIHIYVQTQYRQKYRRTQYRHTDRPYGDQHKQLYRIHHFYFGSTSSVKVWARMRCYQLCPHYTVLTDWTLRHTNNKEKITVLTRCTIWLNVYMSCHKLYISPW